MAAFATRALRLDFFLPGYSSVNILLTQAPLLSAE